MFWKDVFDYIIRSFKLVKIFFKYCLKEEMKWRYIFVKGGNCLDIYYDVIVYIVFGFWIL